jgi:RNase P subunit RPR2
MLDTPLKEMFCSYCKQSAAPGCQVRLSPDESGQKTHIIAWTCSNCEYEHATPDDVSILSAEIIETIEFERF